MILAKGNEQGGAASHLAAFAQALTRGHPQFTYHFAVAGDGYLYGRLLDIGVPTTLLPPGRLTVVPRFIRFLCHISGHAFINAHGPRMNTVAALAAQSLRCRWTSTIHSDPRDDFLGRPVRGAVWTRINTLSLRFADGLFAVNPDYMSLCGKRPAYHVPNATVFEQLPKPNSHYRWQLRQKLQLAPDTQVVGVAARLHPNKNIDVLIRALPYLKRTDVHLAIAGWGPMEEALRRLTHELGLTHRVHFLGYCENVSEFYAGLDVHVLCSRSEGTGLSILEAGFHGIPNVGTDIPGIRQLIDHEKTGLLAPVGDAYALAACIDHLLADPDAARSLAACFQATVIPKHTPEELLAAYERGFQALLGSQETVKRRSWPL
ncbi:MAG: glycosyltransferase family 4 protein [Alicyclobacillus herbarius]|uniref:glycosyltransferase family 4 protein n=1 Tax=Alicyclobacillus herbarius TaxID=122960 RepID=UPI00235393B9|nr:glycosyltransferase family 4 protein [Alicyclobacillus herbarius]MCL6632659.1 glycosyltransferase family 4 protein [Alicyclobacillus herbarius]